MITEVSGYITQLEHDGCIYLKVSPMEDITKLHIGEIKLIQE